MQHKDRHFEECLICFCPYNDSQRGPKLFKVGICFLFFCGRKFLPECPPKNENSVNYSPSCSSKPVCISFFFWDKNKKNVRMLESKQLQFPSACVVFFCPMELYENQWELKLFAYSILQNVFFIFTEQS